MSDTLKFITTTSPITRYENEDGTWTIDALRTNESLALDGTSIVLTKTFADRIKIVTYELTDSVNSLYTESSETFTTVDGTALSSSTASMSSGDDDEDSEESDDDGEGDDNYDGSSDDDFHDGGLGDDDLDGGSGDDELWGGDGNDSVLGGLGADTLLGETGDDDLDGGDGDDDLSGGDDDDTLSGDDGDDSLTGGSGIDSLSGGNGADYLYAGSGDDTVDGGAGNDTIIGGDGAGDDIYKGGKGTDSIKYASATAAITVNISKTTGSAYSTSTDASIGTDVLNGIENIYAGDYADTLIGSSVANIIDGSSGDDTVYGGLGNDSLTGGAGSDLFVFNSKLNAKSNLDTITDFTSGDDVLELSTSIFKKLVGTLSASNLVNGTKALDSDDYLVFNNNTLYYDADGSGNGKAVAIAQLTGVTSLDITDLVTS